MRSRLRSGVLLAGGASARFGTPKGLAPFAGARLADRPLGALHEVCDEVLVASNDPRAAQWFPSCRVVTDVHGFRGGLSALATACVRAAHETVVVCAWDMPFVTAALLDELAAAVDEGARCCVPMHADHAFEPLCAAYRRTEAMTAVTQILASSDDRSAHRLPGVLAGTEWRIDRHLAADDAARVFLNVNTHDDLELAQHWCADHPSPTAP